MPALAPLVGVRPRSPMVGTAPAFAAGVVTLSPGGISSAEAFGTASFSEGAVTVSPVGIATGESFGVPTLQLAGTIGPQGIPTAEAFGVATLSAGPVTLSPSGIATAEAFGHPTLTGGSGVFAYPDPLETHFTIL